MVKELKKFIYETKINIPVNPSLEKSPGVYEWCGSDDLELFEKNLKSDVRKKYLEQYIDKPIEYKINKQMLRCDFDIEEIGDQPVDLYLGCSHTFGSGHYKENTWPSLMSKYTGNIEINLGRPGGDIEASYMRLLQYVRRLNVVNVFHLQPPYYRYGYRTDNAHSSWIVWKDEKEMKEFYGKDYVWNNYLADGTREYNYMKYLNLIRYECNKLNIPYYHSNIRDIKEEDTDYILKEYKNLWNGEETMEQAVDFIKYGDIPARDLFHYPVSIMKRVSKMFIDLYDEYEEGYVNEAFDIEKALNYNKTLI